MLSSRTCDSRSVQAPRQPHDGSSLKPVTHDDPIHHNDPGSTILRMSLWEDASSLPAQANAANGESPGTDKPFSRRYAECDLWRGGCRRANFLM
jgi:hypothetical protein